MQASEGLRRIHEVMRQDPELGKSIQKNRDKKQEENLAAKDNKPAESNAVVPVDIDSLEKKKAEGNELFKQSKIFVSFFYCDRKLCWI